MLTREVRLWLEKIERGQYSYEDAMSEFVYFSKYLTRDEIKFLKNRVFAFYKMNEKKKYLFAE